MRVARHEIRRRVIRQTLGPYRVIEKLGQGGMGEVYKAQDTRLDRLVAIKILAAAIAGDPAAVMRWSFPADR
jgi:serine/threonine protein kinase